MKTKNLGHTNMCVLCQDHNRTTTSLSVVRSVGRYMYASTVCLFFLARSAAKLYYSTSYIQYVPGSGRFKAVPVSPCNRRRVSQLANTDMKSFILDKAQKGSSLRSQQGICTVYSRYL